MIIILDTSLLTLLVIDSKPPKNSEPPTNEYKCKNWLLKMKIRGGGVRVFVPEICIYELFRGLLVAAKTNPKRSSLRIKNLKTLENEYIETLPLSREVLDKAAYLYAEAQYQGKTSPKGVDVDKLILAHLELEKEKNPGRKVIIATQNIKDFQLFNPEDADLWENINL